MPTITPLENFQRMMNHDAPQWLPLEIGATPPVIDLIKQKTGTTDPVEAFDLDFQSVFDRFDSDADQWQAALTNLGFTFPENKIIGSFCVTHVIPPLETLGAASHLREMIHPMSVITSVDQLESLPWPDLDDPSHYAHLKDEVAAIHSTGRVAVGDVECTAFELAWYLRGMDNFFMDLMEENGIGDWLIDYFATRSARTATEFCKAGVDVIKLGDDIGTQRGMMMSLDFYRQHIKPRFKKVIDTIRANETKHTHIFYHSDGDIRDALPDLIDLDINILNPVQPECLPLGEIVPAYKDHLAFWGMIGTQTTMPFGSPDDVRNAVNEIADLARSGASVIVAPTHVLEPDVSWQNITTLVEHTRSIHL